MRAISPFFCAILSWPSMDPPISLKSNLEFLKKKKKNLEFFSIYINPVLSENKIIRKKKKKHRNFQKI